MDQEQHLIDCLLNSSSAGFQILANNLRSVIPDVETNGAKVYGALQHILACGDEALGIFLDSKQFIEAELKLPLNEDIFDVIRQIYEQQEAILGPGPGEVEESKTSIFKQLYTQAIPANLETLQSPYSAISMLDILLSDRSDDDIQNALLELLGFENIEILGQLILNRKDIVKLCKESQGKAGSSKTKGNASASADPYKFGSQVTVMTAEDKRIQRDMKKLQRNRKNQKTTNLDLLVQLGFDSEFVHENHRLGLKRKEFEEQEEEPQGIQYVIPQSFSRKQLPANTIMIKTDYYQMHTVPAPQKAAVSEDVLIPIDAIPEWARPAFKEVKRFNPMQSQVFECIFFTNDNCLVSAPTGAGKTNIALLGVINVIRSFMDEDQVINEEFKIIYVAPMKALAAEVTEKFSQKLGYLGIICRELTGDMQMTKAEIARTHIIVTTPEKWDVVTRKSDSFAGQVKLLIIDEIHLLDDERGPVLECLVSRALRQVEISQNSMRIVALSATLPNYKDVARFIAAPENGIFYFDGKYRPIPLEQNFIACKTVANVEKQKSYIMDACYEMTLAQLKKDKQVMIFVHSRRDTIATANKLRDMAINNGDLGWFECCYSQASMIQVGKSRNRDLKFLFESGFGIHNAGILRKDRNLTETLFKEKNINVLVCTATLAWGVNLPAHCVIIKGTEIYDASAGGFKDIGQLDVQQIFGRAGRPDFDTSGSAYIITSGAKITQYLEMLVFQRPIESRFLSGLEDALNAEISLGTVCNIREATRWLTYTYFNVRLMRNPLCYGYKPDQLGTHEQRTAAMDSIIREAAKKLHRTRMIRFSESSTSFAITSLGRIASNYYIKADSIASYTKAIHESMSDEEILDMFANSTEFEQIKVRDEEMQELHVIRDNLCDNWIKLDKKALNDVPGKVICLLWAYWAQLPIDAFSLVSDMSYIVQNGGRILRALFEICQKRFYGCTTERLLQIGRGLERRVILGYTPLYQFSQRCNIGGFTQSTSSAYNKGGFISEEILWKLDSRGFTIDDLREMPPNEIGHVLNHSERGKEVKKFIRLLPRLDFDFIIRPITGNIVNFDLTLKPTFEWSDRWHGSSLSYWIWVDDGNAIMHVEHYQLHKSVWEKGERPILSFAVPVQEDKRNDYYYVRLYGEHWCGVDIDKEADMSKVVLPLDDVQHTELLDLIPLPKSVLQNDLYESLFTFDYFNPIQTQVFHTLYHNDTNALVGAPTGSGKTITAELALFRLFNNYPKQKAIYVAPLKALAKERIKDWRKRFETVLGKKVVELTGDFTPDIEALNSASILVTTPEKWDGISRNWQHRGYVRDVGLVIIDEIHLLGQDRGPVLEVIVSRMRYIANQVNKTCRIIGLSTALANAQDLANWLGIGIQGFFNFRPSVRPVPLQVHIDGFTEKAYCPRMASMNKPAYNAIRTYASDKPALVFVSSRRQTRLTAFDLIAYCAAEQSNTQGFLQIPAEEMAAITSSIIDGNLRHTLNFGIGLHHSGLPESDRNIVEELFANGSIFILICTSTLAWGVNFPAHLVIIKGTEYFEAKERRYVDFPMTDVLQMMGRAGRPQFDTNGTVCVYVQEEKRNFYKTFLYQPFPVESSLVQQLPAHINAEINSGTITSKLQALNYLTWTYYFRRLTRNPKFYGLEDQSLEGINAKLGEVIDEALAVLIENECIKLEEDNSIAPQFLGYIASFYYISPVTCRLFKQQLEQNPNISYEQILRLLSDAAEFDEIPVRHNEDQVNDEISKMVPLAVDRRMLDDPHVKTFLLLQSWFSGISFPISDYLTDAKLVIDSIVRIIYAMVDIAAEYSSMENTLKATTLLQMVVQGQWYYHSSMKNVPSMTEERLYKLFKSDYNIETLAQLAEQDPKELEQIFKDCDIKMTQREAKPFFRALNILPRTRVEWELISDTTEGALSSDEDLWGDSEDPSGPQLYPGQFQQIQITLERENQYASQKPAFAKTTRSVEAGYWLILGDKEMNKVLAIKRVASIKRRFQKYVMGVTVPESNEIELFLISDSYLGLDQQYTIA